LQGAQLHQSHHEQDCTPFRLLLQTGTTSQARATIVFFAFFLWHEIDSRQKGSRDVQCSVFWDFFAVQALPCKFCEEHNIQKHVTMTDSTGQRRWHMRFQARRSSNSYTISNGWREFSYDHGLETGDELVFTLLSSSHFLVAFAAFDGLGGTRAMHPIRDGDEYPWKINHSRLACLSWDTRHSKEREENVSVTASPREENVSHEETLLQPSETRPIQGVEKATAFVQNVGSILFPKELNPRGDNSQSLQVHSSEGRLPEGGQKHSVQDKPTTTLPNKPRIALPIKPRVFLPSKLNPSEEKVERFCQCKKVMVSKHRPT